MKRDEIPPGTLYLLILKTLSLHGPLHGYEMADSIQQSSEDILQVEEGSLYPALQPPPGSAIVRRDVGY
jgi:PadR family transcriptional regulator, regulatory protein PadR